MKIIITESQHTYLRRQEKIKELVDLGIKTILEDPDVCDYSFRDFFEEIKWQVSDNYKILDLPKDLDPAIVQDWVSDNFHDQIKDFYVAYVEPDCEEYNDDDDEDYLSGHLYGVDNN